MKRNNILLVLLSGALIGFLSIYNYVGIVLFILFFVFLIAGIYKRLYRFFDFPLIMLLFGTLAFGRAFSIWGVEIGSIKIFVTEIALISTIALVLFRGNINDFRPRFPKGAGPVISVYLLIGVIYMVLGLAKNGFLAFRDIVYCFYAFFLIITLLVFDTEEKLKGLCWIVIPGGIITFFISLCLSINIFPDDSFVQNILIKTKSFNLSLYCGLIAIFGMIFFIQQKGKSIWAGMILAVFFILSIILRVRSGWIAFFVTLIFSCFLTRHEFKLFVKKYRAFFLFVILCLIIFVDFQYWHIIDQVKEEVNGILSWKGDSIPSVNVKWRFCLWQQLINKIIEHPFLGWGYGNQTEYFVLGSKIGHIKGIGSDSGIVPAHNHILSIVHKMGFLGLYLFLLINLKIFIYGLRYISICRNEFNRKILIACLCGILYWHCMALFIDMIESPPTSIILWILLGLMLSVVYIDKNNDKQTQRAPN